MIDTSIKIIYRGSGIKLERLQIDKSEFTHVNCCEHRIHVILRNRSEQFVVMDIDA